MSNQAVLNHRFLSTPHNVRIALSVLNGYIERVFLTGNIVTDTTIVVAEVLNNIVEHAYANRCDGFIQLRAELTPDGLVLDIFDHGCVMPNNILPIGYPPEIDVLREDLPEGEFGWFLIQSLTCDLTYTRIGEENRLHFVIPLAKEAVYS